MKFRIAIVLIALVAPAIAQRGVAHGGSFGSRGYAGRAGFSGSPGFSHPGGIVRPGQPVSYGALGSARLRGNARPNDSRPPIPFSGNRFVAIRPPYRSEDAALARNVAGGGDRSRDPSDTRRHSFERWYLNTYPTWPGYGYPYVIDPGFYNWGNSDNPGSDQSSAAPEYPAPYQDYGYGAAEEIPQGFTGEVSPWNSQGQQPSSAGATVSPTTEQPLTVIFKSGRAPVKMQNYMMTAKLLTNLDSQHYEQIPLDQIDFAATQRVNNGAGVGFQIPGATRD